MIRIAVIEDHPATLEGLVTWIEKERDMQVVYSSTSGEEAARRPEYHDIDVVICDVKLGAMEGFDVVQWAKLVAKRETKFVLYSSFPNPTFKLRAKLIGVHEFADISTYREDWIQMIRGVHAGEETWLSKQSAEDLQLMANELSSTELMVLKCIAAGNSSQRIADAMSRSIKTIETHRTNILRKLEASNMTEAVSKAHRLGLMG